MAKFRYIVIDTTEDLTLGTDDVEVAKRALKTFQFDCYIDTVTGIRVEYFDAEPEEVPEFVDIQVTELNPADLGE